MAKTVRAKVKNVIATFPNREVYERRKAEIPPDTLCLVEEKEFSVENAELIFDGSSYRNGVGVWNETIDLLKPWTDFDKLIILGETDTSANITMEVLDVKMLYYSYTEAVRTNKIWFFIKNYYGKELKNTSTTTKLIHHWTKMHVTKIWGWKA